LGVRFGAFARGSFFRDAAFVLDFLHAAVFLVADRSAQDGTGCGADGGAAASFTGLVSDNAA
jgi:hypothetical protein